MSQDVRIAISLLLPFLASVWVFWVIRRKAAENPVSVPYTRYARSAYWLGGLLLFWIINPILTIYIYDQLTAGHAAMGAKAGMPAELLWSILLVSGFWGSLVPFRTYAREGKRSFWVWLLGAVIFALLYYILSLFMQ